MKTLNKLLDPGRPWLLVLILSAVLVGMFGCDAHAADVTPYQSMLNTAASIQTGQNTVLTEYARAQTARETEKAASLVACSQMKNDVTQALCVLGVNGNLGGSSGIGGGMPQLAGINLPAPPPEPEGWGSKAWNGFLAVTDRGLNFLGVRENRRGLVDVAQINAGVSIVQSNNTAAVTIASYNQGTSIARLIQAPAANNTTNTSTVLSGQGVIGNGSYVGPVTRNCTGGNGQAGTGTATVPAGPGPAGSANC